MVVHPVENAQEIPHLKIKIQHLLPVLELPVLLLSLIHISSPMLGNACIRIEIPSQPRIRHRGLEKFRKVMISREAGMTISIPNRVFTKNGPMDVINT